MCSMDLTVQPIIQRPRRSFLTPIHPFFMTLSSRPRSLSKHVKNQFLSSSPVCYCQLFPSTPPSSHRLPALPSRPCLRICLSCARVFTHKTYAGGRLAQSCSRALEDEWAAYYNHFYTPEEEDRILSEEPTMDNPRRMRSTTKFLLSLAEEGGLTPPQNSPSLSPLRRRESGRRSSGGRIGADRRR